MSNVFYYDIHGFVKIKLVNLLPSRFDRFYRYEHFHCSPFSEIPDINVEIGPFKCDRNDLFSVDHKYFVADNYIYVKDCVPGARWELEIKNIENEHIYVRFNPESRNPLMFPKFLSKDMLTFDCVLHPLINLLLLRKDIVGLHSSAVCKNGKVLLNASIGGNFKTTNAMLFYKRGYDYMSDDFSFIRGKDVFSYPTSVNTVAYRLKHKKNEYFNAIDLMRILLDIILRKRIGKVRIKEKGELAKIYLVLKTNKNKNTFRDVVSGSCFLNSLMANENFETISLPFSRYMRAYSYIFPNNSIEKTYSKKRALLEKYLKGIDFKIAEVNERYGKDHRSGFPEI